MKLFERSLVVIGLLAMAVLLWKLDASAVWSCASSIGWGLLLIFAQQIIDHVLNAWGWFFSFNRRDASTLRFWRLVVIRVVGDGVNYLTPSATIAGEVIRPAMLTEELSSDTRIASVVVARFTQSLGQALFIMLGMAYIVYAWPPGQLAAVEFIRRWFFVPMAALALTLSAVIFYAWRAWYAAPREAPASPGNSSASSWLSIRAEISGYFMRHPGRFLISAAFFTAGYAWGTVEIYIICLFMGVPVSVPLALTIEVLSSVIDGVFFMIPAKIGTQEGGKTAIFTGLGLPAAQGFALGLLRHVREISWAGLGLAVYALDQRRRHHAGGRSVCAPFKSLVGKP